MRKMPKAIALRGRHEEAREKYKEAVELYQKLGIEKSLANVKRDLKEMSDC